LLGVVEGQLPNPIPTLPDNALKPTIPDPSVDKRYQAPLVEEIHIPVEALLRATLPVVIRVRRIDLSAGTKQELIGLTERLSEVDTAIAQYQRKMGEKSFQNLLRSLQALVLRTAPQLSGGVTSEQIEKAVALLEERTDLNRRIWGIEHPGGVMKPGPYVEPARSGDSGGNYQVYRSDEPATGSVVGPVPPPCHQEEQSRRVYRETLEPNGFDGNGTALYRNVYHAFPIPELVTVCP
jgi:hypothetical protein